MSERAYSEELNEEMSAFKAHKYSLEGKLKSAKAFQCHDPNCGIKLTCSNWAVKDAKRIYFTPSNRDVLHSIACSTVSGDEENRQVEVETEQGKRTISKNGIIAMRKATNKSKTNHSNEHDVEDVDVVSAAEALVAAKHHYCHRLHVSNVSQLGSILGVGLHKVAHYALKLIAEWHQAAQILLRLVHLCR